MVVGILATGITFPWVSQRLLPRQHRFVQLLTVIAIVSLPVTGVLAGFYYKAAIHWPLDIWIIQYFYVVVISFIVIFGSYITLKAQGLIDADGGQEANGSQVESRAQISGYAKILQRLPSSYQGAELYAISSEDHYLRVYTNQGEELILMRLSDAIRELEQVRGMQTHRSWWVALDAVVEHQRKNGKLILTLKSGVQVPVSRSFDKAVKESGFS